MSKKLRSHAVKFKTDDRAKLEQRARRSFNQAIRRSGGLRLTSDGTLEYLDDLESLDS